VQPRIKLPNRPRIPRLPGGRVRGAALPSLQPKGLPDDQNTDEHGLNRRMVALMSPLARLALSRAYEYWHMDKRQPPSVFFTAGSSGTMPELVFFGLLLLYGYQPGQGAQHFVFQKALLGGRVPGGSLADFVVFNGPRPIAVYVDSFYHSLANPFGAGQKRWRDKILFERVLSRATISEIRIVNGERYGYPLENGPDSLIRLEIESVLTA
jgi:hypothetical protein